MAPIRRYLRISKHSVLECRIFLENPADGPRWLLRTNDPALPKVMEAIRPFVLPKLREENERAKGTGKKKNRIKDVVATADFEVSIFLTPIGTRHSLVTKSKTFTDASRIPDDRRELTRRAEQPVVIREESDDEDRRGPLDQTDAGEDTVTGDEKKLHFQTTYEGYSIWGWVLCLLVTRKGGPSKTRTDCNAGQALMEEWISSTQQQQQEEES